MTLACFLPPSGPPGADSVRTHDNRAVDPTWVGARLAWTGTVAPGFQPTAAEWRAWWAQARLVPQAAWYELVRVKRPTWLACRMPITHLPFLTHLIGVPVGKYADGRTFTYDELPGLGDPVLRLDILHWTTSVCLTAHEVFHALDAHVLGWMSRSNAWLRLWRLHAPKTGDYYLVAHADEFFAEAAALWCVHWDRVGEFVKRMPEDIWHFFNHELIVIRGWTDRLPE